MDELEPAYEPKLVVAQPCSHPVSPAGEFLNRIDAKRESWALVGVGGFISPQLYAYVMKLLV